jgi:hypothetical protein
MKKQIIFFISIFAYFTYSKGNGSPNFIPTNRLVGWCPFNGETNDKIENWYKVMAKFSNLTLNRFGIINNAFSFNGKTSNISIPYIATTRNTARSISDWLKSKSNKGKSIGGNVGSFTHAEDLNIVIGYGPRSTNYPGNIGFRGCDFNFGGYNFCLISRPSVNDNLWHHNFAAFDSVNKLNLFINSFVINSTIISFSKSGRFNYFGFSNLNCSQWLSLLDYIGIWNRMLTQQEVTGFYNAINFFLNKNKEIAKMRYYNTLERIHNCV